MKTARILVGAAAAFVAAQSAMAAYTNVLIDATTHNGSFENGLILEAGKTDRGLAVDEWALSYSGTWARFTLASYVADSATDGNIGVTFNNGVTATITSDPIYQAMNSNDMLTLTFDMVDRTPGDTTNTFYEAIVVVDGKEPLSFGVQQMPVSGSGQYSGQVLLPSDCLFYSIKIVAGVGGSDNQNCLDNVTLARVGDAPLEPEAIFSVFMGAGVCNGDWQSNDPFVGWTDLSMTNALPFAVPGLVTNTTGRRQYSGSADHVVLQWGDVWTAQRTYYSGGNDAWGVDGSILGDMAGYPNTYFFMNSGDSTVRSSACPATLYNGDQIMVQFDMLSQTLPTAATNTPANCAGMVLFNDGAITNSWTAEETYVTNTLQATTFTKVFPVTADVTNMQVVLYFSTGRGYADNPTRSANKCLLDNVRVFGLSAPSGAPINIVALRPVAAGIFEMEIDIQGGATRQITHPVGRSSLNFAGWTHIPHSDDGLNPFVQTNLLYSIEAGTNRVIYVQSGDAQAFFGISKD